VRIAVAAETAATMVAADVSARRDIVRLGVVVWAPPRARAGSAGEETAKPAQRNHPETSGLRASDPYRHHVASGMQPPFL
jgi:hypothetical protein